MVNVFQLIEENGLKLHGDIEHFAELVAAAEREACLDMVGILVEAEREMCAKVCDQKVDAEYATSKVDHNEMGWTQACAIAIRARADDLQSLRNAIESAKRAERRTVTYICPVCAASLERQE